MNNDVVVALTNPKSPTNVGAVLRAAGCFGVGNIVYSGNRYDIAKKYATDTQQAIESVNLNRVENFIDAKPEDYVLVCVDLVEGAIPLPNFKHPEKAMYLFGPEDGSIKQELIDKADHVVYMPTKGSLNLAASVNVVLYDRTAKSAEFETDNELIKTSRDVNNRLKV
jgi:tRNA(Leu) C34 or U34 (ribose-2'-O)-methylase TrmL|tara:strand:+ start:447 stop:947 length:501 start_codon:yes stop_codon:yes gene_type:complete